MDKTPETALIKSVQATTDEKGGGSKITKRAWKWTKRKRKAVQLLVKGQPITRIADELGVHRNTIRNWRDTPEFNASVMSAAREYVNHTRYKRVHETGIITDQLARQVASKLSKLGKAEANQVDLNHLQVFLREYREFRSQERSDFGDDIKRYEGTFNVAMAGGETATPGGEASMQSFKRFVEDNAGKIPERLVTDSESAQEALVEATKVLLRETELLEDLHQEDESAKDYNQ